ncbi:MAG TPA: efflux RND transporter permease subunit, partial [Anaeromyxobacteraceae bacterium]|nr:efflux RND transporter permease subunit [Anaeromyxobacteraceae bacterium]
ELGDAILLSVPGGAHVRLRDVATITREYGHDDAFVRSDGKTALVLSVEMQEGNDITRFGNDVDDAIAAATRALPPSVKIARVADQPRVVRTAVNHFLRDFGLAIVSVIAVTMLLLPLRVAGVAALTIPVCIFVTLGILNALGVELQTVSLAGLIVVLGMVVDNAIVIVDDHVERLDAGADAWTAAWQSVRALFVPVFTATLAIVISYVPFTWFLTGIAGDFVASLPVTIAAALGTSLVVAALLVPILSARFIRRGLHRTDGGRPSFLDRLQRAYDRTLEHAFHRPLLTASAGVLSVAAAAALAALVPQQLFPKVDRNQFAVEITLPPGRPLAQTDAVVRRVETILREDPRVVNVTSFVGTSSPRFHTLYAPGLPGRNRAQLLVSTVDEAAAVAVLTESEARFTNAFPEGWVRWKQLDLQATPAPIEVRLSGDDRRELRAFASRIEAQARTIPGATWVRNDWEEPVESVEVVPDADAAARLGISPSILQASLAVGSRKGFPVATLWEEDYPVRVVLGDDPREPETMESFRQQLVSSPLLGAAVPLEQLGDVRPSWADGAIVRRNGVRTLTVRVDVAKGVLASTVQKPLETFVDGLGPTPGVSIGWGGEKEDMERYYGPLTTSLLTSVGFIYVVLLFQFRRHRKALLVMLTMPLSLLGAMLGLFVTRLPFGLTAFLGVISLMGIVVLNGIIL